MVEPTALQQLLHGICACPQVALAAADPGHPCATVVGQQRVEFDLRQVPEPWAGRLDIAPLLFISSNPSLDENEPYPRAREAGTAAIERYFNERFGEDPDQVQDGVYPPPHTGTRRRGVSYWVAVRANARLVHDRRDVVPGRDYALTEVVHCKSRAERGVAAAAPLCTELWLQPVLQASPATVLVLVGAVAQQAAQSLLGDALPYWKPRTATLGGQPRLLLAVRHPNYRGPRRWRDQIDPQDLQQLRDAVSASTE